MKSSQFAIHFASRKNGPPGFTLVELLVVISIIGVLVGLTLPAVQMVREAARRISCANNMRQLSLAIANYESSMQAFPPGRVGCDDAGEGRLPDCPPELTPEQKNGASGFCSILPQLEQQALFDELDVANGGLWNRNVDDLYWYFMYPTKCRAIKVDLVVLNCPGRVVSGLSDVYLPVRAAVTNYAMCQGTKGPDSDTFVTKYENDGAFLYKHERHLTDFLDGMSTTMTLGEVVMPTTWESSNVWNYSLANADCLRTTCNPLNTLPGRGLVLERQNGAFASWHPGGGQFAFADGHVEFLTETIDLEIYRGLSTLSGGEVLK